MRSSGSGSYAMSVVSHVFKWSLGILMWICITNGIYQTSKLPTRGRGNYWMKASINLGGWYHFRSITLKNHERYFIPEVEAGEKFSLCLAALSRSVEVYSVVLNRCDTHICIFYASSPPMNSPAPFGLFHWAHQYYLWSMEVSRNICKLANLACTAIFSFVATNMTAVSFSCPTIASKNLH